jgi:hypothetical protein
VTTLFDTSPWPPCPLLQALDWERVGPQGAPPSPERRHRLAVQEGATALIATLLPAIEPVRFVQSTVSHSSHSLSSLTGRPGRPITFDLVCVAAVTPQVVTRRRWLTLLSVLYPYRCRR